MSLAQQLLAEFEAEALTTKKFLSRIPEEKFAWKPHEKSMTAGQLALHMAVVPGQVVQMAQQTKVDMPPSAQERPAPRTMQEIMTAFDDSVATVRRVLPTFSDDAMQETWSITVAGKTLAIPRAAMLRSILLNHWYHHRGQLGVYLRLLGAKVPSAYGPSGDEMPDFMNE